MSLIPLEDDREGKAVFYAGTQPEAEVRHS